MSPRRPLAATLKTLFQYAGFWRVLSAARWKAYPIKHDADTPLIVSGISCGNPTGKCIPVKMLFKPAKMRGLNRKRAYEAYEMNKSVGASLVEEIR